MPMNAHINRLLLIATLAAGLAAGPVMAREPDTDAAAATGAASSTADDLTTGSISGPVRTREQKIEDCMAIWEPATHMTKTQWRRTCTRQLREDY